MLITPYGKKKESEKELKQAFSFGEEAMTEEEPIADSFTDLAPDSDSSNDFTDDSKVLQVERALGDILGEPSLDNLMVVLKAIGLENVTMSLKEGKLNLSGVIELEESANKIKKE